MPNYRVLEEAARLRRRKRRSAKRLYRRYQQQVPALIRQLGTTQAAHDRAFDLLSRMGDTTVAELLEALSDPTLDPIAADEVVSLLGAAGDQRAQAARWAFFVAHRDDPEQASTAALSLSGLGESECCPMYAKACKPGTKNWYQMLLPA